jgi:protein required for attachment to host cells
MGFYVDGDNKYDAFLSYAHADNEAHNNWVTDFEQYLRKMVIAELKRSSEFRSDEAPRFNVCLDETSFPQGGDLDGAIKEKVRQSQYLFIFLGKGYLKSKWCLSELDLFRGNVGGAVEDALKRLYIIVLDKEALDRLRDGVAPNNLPQQRKHLWTKLRDVTQKAIRKEDFLLDDGTLVPVYPTSGKAHPDFHKHCAPIVKELARKLIDSRGKLQPQTPSPADRTSFSDIVIGAIPKRLEAARDELVKTLNGTKTHIIEEAELRRPTDEIRERLKNARLLVQPFDYFRTLFERGDPRGGHLALQKKLFEACHANEGPDSESSIVWWEPTPTTRESSDAPRIDNYDKRFLDELPDAQKRHCSAQAFSAELLQHGKRLPVVARVWIEWEESDKEIIEDAKNIVLKYFDEHCQQKRAAGIYMNAELQFGDADWSILEKALEEKPDGVVIVYNENKDYGALKQQEETISNLEEVLKKEMFPGIFHLRPGMYKPSGYWSVVRFRAQDHQLKFDIDEIREFVSNLFEVLYHKYRANKG